MTDLFNYGFAGFNSLGFPVVDTGYLGIVGKTKLEKLMAEHNCRWAKYEDFSFSEVHARAAKETIVDNGGKMPSNDFINALYKF